jgi:hypothetical protein
MLELLHDALIALGAGTVQLHRRLRQRDHDHTPQPCQACTAQSRNHPAGPLTRYTQQRLSGHPICERHNATDITHLLGKLP